VAAGAFVKEGKLRLVATTGEKRTAGFASTPTVAEQGLKDYSASVWYGFVVPKGTPDAVVARLNAEINKAVATPAVRDRFGPLGAEPYTGTVADFRTLLATEETKWAKAIRSAKIRLE
jgi:tripartite-type tricarboxylate transporter receptor subunit TctC